MRGATLGFEQNENYFADYILKFIFFAEFFVSFDWYFIEICW